jgi:hypothetical protein
MTSPILETVVDVARRERKRAVRNSDYAWAIVTALVETWATDAMSQTRERS